ncbi:hypothetical protein CFE70_010523 [Pyrenophora teres f. teres 0-1]
MFPQTPVVLACMLQLCGTAAALPTQQAPLLLNGPKNVQAVRSNPDGKHMTSDMPYVLTLTDPDAPSRDNPEWSEMCHWIVTNLTTAQQTFSILPIPEFGLSVESEKDEGEGQDGLEDVVEYKPPGPPPQTGKHRYVFLVFAPKNGTTERLTLSKPQTRRHWGTGREGGGVREWARANGLVPVAANFIYSENEEQ